MPSIKVVAPMIQFVTRGNKVRHASCGDVLDRAEIAPDSLRNLRAFGMVVTEPAEGPGDPEPVDPDPES